MPKSYFNERLTIERRSLIANAHRQYIDLRIKGLIKLLMPSGTSYDGWMDVVFAKCILNKCVTLHSLLAIHNSYHLASGYSASMLQEILRTLRQRPGEHANA